MGAGSALEPFGPGIDMPLDFPLTAPTALPWPTTPERMPA